MLPAATPPSGNAIILRCGPAKTRGYEMDVECAAACRTAFCPTAVCAAIPAACFRNVRRGEPGSRLMAHYTVARWDGHLSVPDRFVWPVFPLSNTQALKPVPHVNLLGHDSELPSTHPTGAVFDRLRRPAIARIVLRVPHRNGQETGSLRQDRRVLPESRVRIRPCPGAQPRADHVGKSVPIARDQLRRELKESRPLQAARTKTVFPGWGPDGRRAGRYHP